MSVTQIRIIRRGGDGNHAFMRLRPMLHDGLHIFRDRLRGSADSKLSEKEAELLIVCGSKLTLCLRIEIPEALLERSKRFLARLVDELLV